MTHEETRSIKVTQWRKLPYSESDFSPYKMKLIWRQDTTEVVLYTRNCKYTEFAYYWSDSPYGSIINVWIQYYKFVLFRNCGTDCV